MARHAEAPVILAAGGVLEKQETTGTEVMIVYRPGHNDWTLPKGKLKKGESFLEAALREVEEETGCVCQAQEYLGAVSYEVNAGPKVVLFWRMSVVSRTRFEPNEEIAEAVWVPRAEALQRLTYAHERQLIGDQTRNPETSSVSPLRAGRHSSRLVRELTCFRTELGMLEQRSDSPGLWVQAAHEQLSAAERCAVQKDLDGGWTCLQAAQRYAVFGLTGPELAVRAAILREESSKVPTWRGKAMYALLSVSESELTAERVSAAMKLRDENSWNQYHKIHLIQDQLAVLIWMSLCALPLLIPLAFRGADDIWGYRSVMAVMFFGYFGAAFSAAQSLIRNAPGDRIPERVANHWVTLVRVLSGPFAGLAGYALYRSRLLHISVGAGGDEAAASFAIAFVFGYAGEWLVARIAAGT